MTCFLEDYDKTAGLCIPVSTQEVWFGLMTVPNKEVSVKKFNTMPNTMDYYMCLKCSNTFAPTDVKTHKIKVHYIYCENTMSLASNLPTPNNPLAINY